MSVADKLQTIQNIKEDIKTAINNKGGNVGDDFTQYSTAIDGLSTGGGITKIDVAELGIKFGYSTFTNFPDFYDFSNVTDMNSMFANCISLTTIPLLDTSNVTIMDSMFANCYKLQTISEIDTSNVSSMDSMFSHCENLSSIPLINTSNINSTYKMFYYCSKLQTIPQLNTSNVTSMNYMFYEATNLISLPILNVSKLTSINYYFGITNLENLTDVGGWKNLKIDWNDDRGLVKCPNLTYQSCINILNGLADVTELGSRTLKVHQNFLDTVGDEISIGTSKNWVITA